MWLVSVLFILCNFLTLEPMAENLLGVDHGEEFVLEETTLVLNLNKHSDESMTCQWREIDRIT
jgi:hypothetical protein